MTSNRPQLVKAAIVLIVSLGLLWFSGQFSPATFFEPQSTGWTLWVSYANDLMLPFAFYLFLCLGERWLRSWQFRALLAFIIPTLIEFSQYFYYQIAPSRYIGSFDPVDILMYAIGVGLAVLVEQQILAKLFTPANNEGITLHA